MSAIIITFFGRTAVAQHDPVRKFRVSRNGVRQRDLYTRVGRYVHQYTGTWRGPPQRGGVPVR